MNRRTRAFHESIGTDRMSEAGAPEGSPDRVELGTGRALRTRDHAAIVYWEPSELLATVVPYLIAGLRAGDKVVYVADDLSIEQVADALRQAGVDVAAETASGRLTIVRSVDAFFPGGRFDVEQALAGVRSLAEAAAAEGYTRVRFSVEMTYLLRDAPGIERGAEFEARANEEVFARFPFVCICSFNGDRDQPGVLRDVLRTHPVLLAGGIPLRNPHYEPAAVISPPEPRQARG